MKWKNKSILIIDDDLHSLELLDAYLSPTGANLICSTNGNEGLEKFKSYYVDIVLLDVRLPDCNGLLLIRTFLDIRKVPVIFISANALNELVELGMEAGAKDYLTKPIRLGNLMDVLSNYLN